MDLDTFLTELYVLVDDWYKVEVGERRHVGARERMSDSEVMTVAPGRTMAGRGQLALGARGGALDATARTGMVPDHAWDAANSISECGRCEVCSFACSRSWVSG